MAFKDKLLLARARLGLSQTQLAEKLDVTLVTINRWENDNSSPSKVSYIRFIEFCKANNIIFEGDND